MTGALERLEGKIGRECPANKIGDRCGERIKKVEESTEYDACDEQVALRDLGTLLEVIHDRIFRQLYDVA